MTTDDSTTANAPKVGDRWQFDASVTDAFEDMLRRSIPQYEVMRDLVTDTAGWFIDRKAFGKAGAPYVMDLGASRGSALAPLVDRFGASAHFAALEISDPMLAVLEERFAGMIEAGVVHVERHDLRDGLPEVMPWHPSVILSVLTLQFVPIEYRQSLLRDCYRRLTHGGCLILVEKVLGQADETSRLLVDLYHGMKRGQGYTQEAVDRKALALEGVLVALPAHTNVEFLHGAGFDLVEPIWRYLNFAGWVAVKR